MNLNIGVLGAGFIVPQHLAAFSQWDGVQVVAIASPDVNERDALANEFGIQRTYNDYTILLEAENLDIVDIALPTYLHHDATLKAFAQGAHVLLEKPIALNIEQADGMILAAKRADKTLYVSLNQRFIPEHQRVRELVNAGAIGRLLYASMAEIQDTFGRLNDPEHWFGTWDKGGGGTMMETGTHLVDLVRYICGEVDAVTAVERQVWAKHPNKGDDLALLALECANGAIAELTIYSDAVASPTEHKPKHFYGTEGSLHVDLDDAAREHLVKWSLGRVEREPGAFAAKALQKQPIPMPHVSHWQPRGNAAWWERSVQRSVHHFLEHLLQDAPLAVTATDARAALQIITCAYQSSREERRVVLPDRGKSRGGEG